VASDQARRTGLQLRRRLLQILELAHHRRALGDAGAVAVLEECLVLRGVLGLLAVLLEHLEVLLKHLGEDVDVLGLPTLERERERAREQRTSDQP